MKIPRRDFITLVERDAEIAAEFVRLKVDVIVAVGPNSGIPESVSQ